MCRTWINPRYPAMNPAPTIRLWGGGDYGQHVTSHTQRITGSSQKIKHRRCSLDQACMWCAFLWGRRRPQNVDWRANLRLLKRTKDVWSEEATSRSYLVRFDLLWRRNRRSDFFCLCFGSLNSDSRLKQKCSTITEVNLLHFLGSWFENFRQSRIFRILLLFCCQRL